MITLKTLPNATRQEVFDQVSSHMLKQMKQSVKHSGNCAYRGHDGLKCAAGCLIADDEYLDRFDMSHQGTGWQRLVKRGYVPDAHEDLISELQGIHDACDPEKWVDQLKLLAENEGLEFKEPTN